VLLPGQNRPPSYQCRSSFLSKNKKSMIPACGTMDFIKSLALTF
jgi:hypothetical protein